LKLVAAVRLLPTADQAVSLRDTLERCNAACTWIAELAVNAGKTRQFDLHHLTYAAVRQRFGLAAQATIRCIAKVADAFKVGAKVDYRRNL